MEQDELADLSIRRTIAVRDCTDLSIVLWLAQAYILQILITNSDYFATKERALADCEDCLKIQPDNPKALWCWMRQPTDTKTSYSKLQWRITFAEIWNTSRIDHMLIRQDFSRFFSIRVMTIPTSPALRHGGKALHRQSLAKQGLEEFRDRHSRGEVPIAELLLLVRVGGQVRS